MRHSMHTIPVVKAFVAEGPAYEFSTIDGPATSFNCVVVVLTGDSRYLQHPYHFSGRGDGDEGPFVMHSRNMAERAAMLVLRRGEIAPCFWEDRTEQWTPKDRETVLRELENGWNDLAMREEMCRQGHLPEDEVVLPRNRWLLHEIQPAVPEDDLEHCVELATRPYIPFSDEELLYELLDRRGCKEVTIRQVVWDEYGDCDEPQDVETTFVLRDGKAVSADTPEEDECTGFAPGGGNLSDVPF